MPPKAQQAIGDALSGNLLTPQEVNTLKGQLNNPNLTQPQKNSIAALLQKDAASKLKMQQTGKWTQGVGNVLAGLGSAIGGLGGLGGGGMGGGGDGGGGDGGDDDGGGYAGGGSFGGGYSGGGYSGGGYSGGGYSGGYVGGQEVDAGPTGGDDSISSGPDSGPPTGPAAVPQNRRFLRIANNTGETLLISIKYRTLTDQNQWVWAPGDPADERVARFRIPAGKAGLVKHEDFQINASRIRIWARSESGLEWMAYKEQDFFLFPETDRNGQRLYYAPEMEIATFRFDR